MSKYLVRLFYFGANQTKKMIGGLLIFLVLTLLPLIAPQSFQPLYVIGQDAWWKMIMTGAYIALCLFLISCQNIPQIKGVIFLVLGLLIHSIAYLLGAYVVVVVIMAALQVGTLFTNIMQESLIQDLPKIASLVLVITGCLYVILR